MTDTEILLVEDNPYDAEFTLRALRSHDLGGLVTLVDDGADALAFLLATGKYANRAGAPMPRLVLLDLKLPKLSGIEVLRRVKSEDATRRVPVVILTSSAEEADIAAGYGLGANSYIVKPVNSETYAQAVASVGLYWSKLNRVPHVR